MSENVSYAYRAARVDGIEESGSIDAATREAALNVLASRGLFPIEVRMEGSTEPRRTHLSAADLALGLRMFANLLESGMPMSRSLAALGELAPGSWRTGLPALRDAVREGNSLATALRESPLAFPPIVIGMIQAGEAGSGVPLAVKRAAEVTESMAAVRAAVRNALAYPLVLGFAGICSVALLVGIVLPRFALILEDLGQTLPASTRLILGAAALARAGALPGIGACAVLLVAWKIWLSTDAGRIRWHSLLLSMPVVGAVRSSIATARAAASLSALLDNGVRIAPALQHAAVATGDAAVAARLTAAREHIVAGQGIARAIEEQRAFTPTAVRLVRTGEETGRLSEMLAHAGQLEGERVNQMVRVAVRTLEPALILAFSVVVAVVAAALLQAVYSVRPTP
jgi:general secretion pathway protein F